VEVESSYLCDKLNETEYLGIVCGVTIGLKVGNEGGVAKKTKRPFNGNPNGGLASSGLAAGPKVSSNKNTKKERKRKEKEKMKGLSVNIWYHGQHVGNSEMRA
jgi:hypothetical protein